jgi:hypothetical protein
MLSAPAALSAAARVLNGELDWPFPAVVSASLTYQTTGPTVMLTVAVADFGLPGSSLSVIVYWKLSPPE